MSYSLIPAPGLSSVGAFQKSGEPFVSGGINAASTTEVAFPSVTKFIQVYNMGGTACRVGFSQNGVNSTKYIRVPSSGTSGVLEVMVRSIFISGSTSVDVCAGLTGIPHNLSASAGLNWSGSSGVG